MPARSHTKCQRHTYMYTLVHVYTHMRTQCRRRAHIYAHWCMYIHTHTHTHTHIHMHTHTTFRHANSYTHSTDTQLEYNLTPLPCLTRPLSRPGVRGATGCRSWTAYRESSSSQQTMGPRNVFSVATRRSVPIMRSPCP